MKLLSRRDPDRLFTPQKMPSDSMLRRFLRWLNAVGLNLHPATSGCGTCRNYMLSLETRACHALQPDFPVDVIYTWVDGADPIHIEKRAAFLPRQENIHENAVQAARFRDNDELRYSLRALERFAPWVRSILIVTDRQRPSWLDKNSDKIRIVDHREFIPKQYLPTFNSHVIEAYLHNIPGLAEHYLYLNDDVFLARPCRKTDFFMANGLPLAYVDWRKRRRFGYSYTKTPHAMSYFNTLEILKNRGVRTEPGFITAHGPFAQTKSNAQKAFEFYQDIIEGFAKNRFRTTSEIAMYCHALPLLLYEQKSLVPCDERYYYVQTRRKDRIAYYRAILYSRADHVPPLFFCINDVGDEQDFRRCRNDLRLLLSTYFPTPAWCEADKRRFRAAH
ncbi:Stealth CR1 domain-containing protein [Desulfovibrio sp. OttesenSCG-928-A18]|nr:Stealth CR1 domain-containing protein [Desulfovibrio sp. OttesenSCG-928-A18]